MGRRRRVPPDVLNDDLRFREFVLFKLGQHDMALRILIILTVTTLGLLVTILKIIL